MLKINLSDIGIKSTQLIINLKLMILRIHSNQGSTFSTPHTNTLYKHSQYMHTIYTTTNTYLTNTHLQAHTNIIGSD